MARLQILEYPDPRLRTKAKPVEVFDAALAKQVEDMFETMYAPRESDWPPRRSISISV
jgi:peptide deformylase